MGIYHKLKSNCSAIVAIEFAFIAPILLFLSLLIIEASMIMFYQSAVDDALSSAIRSSKVTKLDRSSIINDIKQKVQDSAYGIPDKENLIITTDLAVDFDTEYDDVAEVCKTPKNVIVGKGTGIGMNCDCAGACPAQTTCDDTDGDGICDAAPPVLSLGGPGDVVTIIAVYKWAPMTPGIKYFFTQPGNSSNNRNFNNVLQANTDGDHVIVSGMTFRNEE